MPGLLEEPVFYKLFVNFLSTELRSFGAVLREKDLSIVVSLDQFNQLPIVIKKN